MPFKFLHEKQYTTGFILFHPQLITKKKKKQKQGGKKNRRQEEKKNRSRERDLFM